MAGHSHWAGIKHKKGKADKQRSNLFSKLSKEITVAAKLGDADMASIPDPSSLVQLPWKPEVGWLAGDLWMNGEPVKSSPRVMLRNQIEKLKKKNMNLKTGVECEYFLISPDGNSIADERDQASKPCYDQSALMRQYDLISEICDEMIKLGWGGSG